MSGNDAAPQLESAPRGPVMRNGLVANSRVPLRTAASRMGALVALAFVVLVAASCTSKTGGSSTLITRAGAKSAPITVTGQPAPAGTGQLEAVSCADADHCWAVGTPNPGAGFGSSTGPSPATVIDTTKNGGATWKAQSIQLPTTAALSGISCANKTTCMAVGTTNAIPTVGLVLVTRDGGKLWTTVGSPAGAVTVVAVQCFSGSNCVALATDGNLYWPAVTSDAGRVWQRGSSLPPGFTGARGLTCPTEQDCMVAGYTPTTPGHANGTIAVTTTGGMTWMTAMVPAGTGLLHAVSCLTAQSCVAVGTNTTTDSDIVPGSGVALTSEDGGQSWATATIPTGLNDGFGISCLGLASCVAVGTTWTMPVDATQLTPLAGIVTTSNKAQTWHTPRSQYVPSGLTGVDCAVAPTCIAVGGSTLARITLPASSETHAPSATAAPKARLR
jgi:photosystem II stability/assembly factor-like uncharacterized protein